MRMNPTAAAISPSMHARFVVKLHTQVFRQKLARHGVTGVNNYQWHNDEALYMGDPIASRANTAEARAIAEMQALIKTDA